MASSGRPSETAAELAGRTAKELAETARRGRRTSWDSVEDWQHLWQVVRESAPRGFHDVCGTLPKDLQQQISEHPVLSLFGDVQAWCVFDDKYERNVVAYTKGHETSAALRAPGIFWPCCFPCSTLWVCGRLWGLDKRVRRETAVAAVVYNIIFPRHYVQVQYAPENKYTTTPMFALLMVAPLAGMKANYLDDLDDHVNFGCCHYCLTPALDGVMLYGPSVPGDTFLMWQENRAEEGQLRGRWKDVESKRTRRMVGEPEKFAKAINRQIAWNEANPPDAPKQVQMAPAAVPSPRGKADKLRELKELFDDGAITEAEWTSEKEKIFAEFI